MNTITILVALIALIEVTRLVLTHKPLSKKSHFKDKLKGTERMMWDLEFKRFKTNEIREDVRKEYDNSRAKLDTLQEQIENFPKDKPKKDKAELVDQETLLERDCNRYAQQLSSLDLEVNGSAPNNQYPDGVSGIKDQINSLRELVIMLKSWIKTL